ncbi:hypothetical protein CLF_103086, partial [Clonorchis sinensis]
MAAIVRMKPPCRRKFVRTYINGTPVALQLDTGSNLTLISKQTLDAIERPPVKHTKCTGCNACSGSLKPGRWAVPQLNDTCYLTSYTHLDLLGLNWINEPHTLDQPLNAVCGETSVDGCNMFTGTPDPDVFAVATVTTKPEARWSICVTAAIHLLASGISLQSILASPVSSLQRYPAVRPRRSTVPGSCGSFHWCL